MQATVYNAEGQETLVPLNQLAPGPEMDRAVAVRLGWTWQTYWSGDVETRGLFPPAHLGLGYGAHDDIPEYSREMNAAWEIVNAFSSDISKAVRYPQFILALREQMPKGEWKTFEGWFFSQPQSAPFYICRAFLATFF